MRIFLNPILLFCAAVLLFVTLPVSTVIAQDAKEAKTKVAYKTKEFCSNNSYSSGDRVGYSEIKEFTLLSSGTIRVDGAKNGGVSVRGEERSDVLVKACVQAWATSDEAARSAVSKIQISTSGVIKAANPDAENNWGVSYEVRVPRNSNLKLNAHNGGISVKSVDGTIEFETLNGGVNLYDVSGDVRGKTTNGGVNVTLFGSGWRGNGLDVETKNGGINLSIPESYAANIETGTVNGGYKSDIPSLNITTENIKGDGYVRSRSRTITTSLNGGGAPIRIITTNGGVRINSSDNSNKN
ncbi:MAG: DUF4097 family beta strand repeat-containing protein [Blastocatellia bacterium]